jgi:hypothetical protein
MVPFAVILVAAVIVFFWHQRSRENEALAEYPTALLALANRGDSIDNPSPASEEMRKVAWAVFQVSAKPNVWREWTPEHREEIRRHLASASSPFLIEEAGMAPGTPRHHFTYAAVMRRLKRLT